MKNARTMVMAAALVVAPATAGAQVTNHVSWQMGFAAGGYPAWHSPGIGLAYQPLALGTGFGFGFGVGISLGFGFNTHDDYWAGYHDGFLGRSHCWDVYWYDPFLDDCWGYSSFGYGPFAYSPFGYSPFGWQSWHNPWWRPHGFLGWPSRRYIARHYYAWAPVWDAYRPYGFYGGRYWGYDHWDRGWGPYPRRQYASRGYGGRSPLFGPQFKEPPVYVTDNGPERPVAKLRPRTPQGGLDDVDSRRGRDGLDRGAQLRDTGRRTARPRNQPGVTTANPRPSTRAAPGRTTRPTPQTRSTPTRRPQPAVRPPTPRRTPTATRMSPPKREPATRATPPRRSPTGVRTAPRPPSVRTTAPRRAPPKVRPAPRRAPPKARPAPKRAPPKARPAPKRAPPKARSAPKRAPPKARSAPRRSPPKARPAPKRAPPRRRGG